MAVLALSLTGCGDGKTAQELQDLRKEVAQMAGEIRELRNVVASRQMREGDMRRPQAERADRFERVAMNGVSWMRHTMPRPTREEMEERRRMEERRKGGAKSVPEKGVQDTETGRGEAAKQ